MLVHYPHIIYRICFCNFHKIIFFYSCQYFFVKLKLVCVEQKNIGIFQGLHIQSSESAQIEKQDTNPLHDPDPRHCVTSLGISQLPFQCCISCLGSNPATLPVYLFLMPFVNVKKAEQSQHLVHYAHCQKRVFKGLVPLLEWYGRNPLFQEKEAHGRIQTFYE